MKWKEYMNAFGLGTKLGVDLPSEDRGFIPDTSVYNKEYRGSWSSCTNLTLGIGQDKMGATPLQLANAMCIIANKGYYYTPHFVRKIDGETVEDTALMNKYRVKHEVLTHISDDMFNAVMDGMEAVVTQGTARRAAIPNISVCAKTGTAEKYAFLDGKRIKLDDNAMFVAFAPKEDPKIAIAVVVENAGYGGTWGGPIARILMEKFLNDTISKASQEEYEIYCKTNKMPKHLKRLQFKEDSIRARKWFEMTKDSSYINKYTRIDPTKNPAKKKEAPEKTNQPSLLAVLPNEKIYKQRPRVFIIS
jgi:penicillin-binding protein 2